MVRPYTLILASSSPRRKELLGWLEIPFSIVVPDVEEKSNAQSPAEIVEDLSVLKGQWVYNQLTKRNDFAQKYFPVVVASDTLVALNSEILGKPRDREDARKMLMKLSGKTHEVLTGVYIGFFNQKKNHYEHATLVCSTLVEFAPITEDQLNFYLNSGDALDKAGAYGIQGQALSFIKGLQGSYSNVVGFPLFEFSELLKKTLGFEHDQEGKWRHCFSE